MTELIGVLGALVIFPATILLGMVVMGLVEEVL